MYKFNYLALLFGMLSNFFLCSSAVFAQSITVDAEDIQQSITMMGGDMERSGANLQNAANKEEIIEWLITDIPFDTWRVRYDKQQELEEGEYDWDFYADDVATMQLIKAANPDIQFFATLKSDYHGYSEGNCNNLPTFIYDYECDSDGNTTGTKTFDAEKYGIFLADYVEFMEDSGLALTYLATAKEYSGVVTADRAKEAIETLIDELDERGVAMPEIIDAGTWSLTSGINLISDYESNDVSQYVYGFSSHNYWSSETKTWSEFVTAANDAGKPAYNEESGHGGGGYTTYEASWSNTLGVYQEKAEYYQQGLQGEAFFEVWPRGVSEVDSDGYYAKPVFFDDGTNGRRMRAYYIMKSFATNAVDSYYVNSTVEDAEDLSTMAFASDDQVALWVVNDGDTNYEDFYFYVENLNLNYSMDIQQIYWDEESDIEGVEVEINLDDDNVFTANINAESINLFVIKPNHTLTPYVRIDNGSWEQDDLATVDEGGSVEFGPQSRINGSWSWIGPDDYTSSSREIYLEDINSAMAGDYVATYTDPYGEQTSLTTTLAVTCETSPSTTAYYKVNDGSWVANDTLIYLDAGDSVLLGPQPISDDAWRWEGPADYSADTREIEFSSFTPDMSGEYTATYTSDEGCSTTLTYYIEATCAQTPDITPYIQLNGGDWSQTNSLEVESGDTVKFGPQTSATGTWYWSGPDDFAAVVARQITIDDFSEENAGAYTVTYQTPVGCSSSYTWNISIADDSEADASDDFGGSLYPIEEDSEKSLSSVSGSSVAGSIITGESSDEAIIFSYEDLTADYNGGEMYYFVCFDTVDSTVATAPKFTLSYDFDGDNEYDRVETAGYFPLDPVNDSWECWSSDDKAYSSAGDDYQDFEGGSISLSIWNALGDASTTEVKVNAASDASVFEIPYE